MAGFNLVAVVDGKGVCLHYDGTLRPVAFGKGMHVVSTNRDLDDPAMGEKRLLDGSFHGAPDEPSLVRYLSSHDGDRPVCKHGDTYGTVSSAIYVESRKGSRLMHADGRPCVAPFRDCSSLLR